ncbi:MAG: DUF4982 domain-containing protein [Bacteroidales bacterium]|nr:DUF4982 domain-containing protein [Bacteroidales bacterium]
MNLFRTIITLSAVAILAIGCSQQDSPRHTIKFTTDWRFTLADSAQFKDIDYDDAQWRSLNLPHDWAIEGDFAEDNPSGIGGGALPGGIGWYRKTFTLLKEQLGPNYFITFDGVFMNSTVFVNGTELGHRPNGYISFQYDLTPYLNEGKNVIAVRVDNSEQPYSRWYSGCGIYRNVWLTTTTDVFIDNWGTYITTPLVNTAKANISVETTVRSKRLFDSDLAVRVTVYDAKGNNVAQNKQRFIIAANNQKTVGVGLRIANPKLWTVDNPYRYKAVTEVYEKDGTVVDHSETMFGIRSFYFDADDGFILNDNHLKINGVCLHHDLGLFGAAVNRRALERRLQMLKAMGCNGIRCSHNPPAPELLDLCDSLGFIVIDEAFDVWQLKKNDHDYARYFDQWHERDLTDMVRRDRNHPSVFIWSVGNEVREQWDVAEPDSISIANAEMQSDDELLPYEQDNVVTNSSSALCTELARTIRNIDPTRPITAGCNDVDASNNLFTSNSLDIIGFNYHENDYNTVPTTFHGKPFVVTEAVSALMTRGYYRMPSDVEYIWPDSYDQTINDPSFACSSYDNCHVPWGCRHEVNWTYVKYMKNISGHFVWTGFDYLGEPTPYGWPARSSFFGIIDLAGFPKDIYYMYQSEWQTDKDVLHLFPHWNWKDGETVDMWCYYNNADEVELYINGEPQGTQQKDSLQFHCSWRVKYQPGEVKVVSRRKGAVVAEKTIRTADRPKAIRLTADRKRILADGEDISFVTVEIVDKNGTLCPMAENDITFEIEGTGFIAGVDNGSPVSLERFKDNHRKAFYGKCIVALQSNGNAGNIRLKAHCDGLSSDEVTINCLYHNQY